MVKGTYFTAQKLFRRPVLLVLFPVDDCVNVGKNHSAREMFQAIKQKWSECVTKQCLYTYPVMDPISGPGIWPTLSFGDVLIGKFITKPSEKLGCILHLLHCSFSLQQIFHVNPLSTWVLNNWVIVDSASVLDFYCSYTLMSIVFLIFVMD